VRDTPRHEQIRTLAVLPLSNLTGEPEQDYYVDGMQDLLITELSRLSALRVTSRQSTKRYRGSQLPAKDIAKELGVDALVEGSLLRKGNQVEVTIQLIDGRSDKHLWAERYARDTSYLFDLVSDMARAIGTEIVSTTVPPGSQVADYGLTGPVDPRAIEAYASGLIHMDRFTSDGIRFAIERFREAVNIEPKFALAWGQLAVAHAMQALQGFAPPRASIEKSRAAALRAIEADDQVAIGHSTLGWARMWSGDLDGACESFEEALRLNPSAPYAMHGDADCLMFAGRFDESVSRTREVLALGPFSAMHNRPLVFHLFLAHRFDEAITAASAAQVRAPGFSMHAMLARIYWAQGDRDEALEAERRELDYRGDTELLEALEQGLDAAGPRGAMHAMAETLVDRAQTAHVDPFLIGESFARAGAVDEALLWLERAVDYGSFESTYIEVRPDFDVLRGDPRYRELADRVYGLGSSISNRP
jgi:TolB-like protein/tetratricopeptide (TPR) repeat protein